MERSNRKKSESLAAQEEHRNSKLWTVVAICSLFGGALAFDDPAQMVLQMSIGLGAIGLAIQTLRRAQDLDALADVFDPYRPSK